MQNQSQQIQVDHFILSPDLYLQIRRYLGTRPHDEIRGIIQALDSLPVVTPDDIKKREKAAMRLAAYDKQSMDEELKKTGPKAPEDEGDRIGEAQKCLGTFPESTGNRPTGQVVDSVSDS